MVEAAIECAARSGLAAVVVADVARRAGVSAALVHYHFATKAQLLRAAAERLVRRRVEARRQALLAGRGLQALDALWTAIAASVSNGTDGTYFEIVAAARFDTELAAMITRGDGALRADAAARLPALLAELGSAPLASPDDLAGGMLALFDGAALRLASGAHPPDVRAAFDAFWLGLVAAGQGGPGS